MASITDDTLFRYCELLYKELESAAEGGIWKGKIVETFGKIPVSNAHYGVVMQSLYNAGCLVQLKRGARGVLTEIQLVRPPEQNQISLELNASKGLTNASSPATLALAKTEELERRLQGINVAEVIADFERRLQRLEGKVK